MSFLFINICSYVCVCCVDIKIQFILHTLLSLSGPSSGVLKGGFGDIQSEISEMISENVPVKTNFLKNGGLFEAPNDGHDYIYVALAAGCI